MDSLIEVTIYVSRVVYGMNENIDDFEGGLIEVIGDRNRKIIIAKEIWVGDICPVTTRLINGCVSVAR